MQHFYLLTGVNISAIENNYQFNKGINILTISKDEALEELKEIKVNICDDAALSERGRLLVNQLNVIEYYRQHSDLMGMAIDFVNGNRQELRSLGKAWKCMFPLDKRTGFRKESTDVWLPKAYEHEFKEIFANKKSIRKLLTIYGKDVDRVRKALTDDDVFLINNNPIRSKAYSRLLKRNIVDDSVWYFYDLDQVSISKRISVLKRRTLTYSIEDLELPYILFHTGHFYEAYQIYNKLAKEMWKNKRYALFFICIFNIHSVSWPAIREIEDKPGTETDTIRKQYVTTDLNTELNQLRLPEGVKSVFSDLVNHVQLTENVISVNETFQNIETQRKGAEKGTLWSNNGYIDHVIWNFITFLDFLTSNYIIMDNNHEGNIYYSTVSKCIVSSNLIPSGEYPYQSKLENLFRETLLILVLNTKTDDLRNIYKEVGDSRKLTTKKEFNNQIEQYLNNLYAINSKDQEIIEDKILEPIFKNIILTCNVIKDQPDLEHLDDLIVKYWQRLHLGSLAKDITLLFKHNPPKAESTCKLLSLVANTAINDIDLNNLASVLVGTMIDNKTVWDDNNFLGYIEFQDSTDFASIVLPVLSDERKHIAKSWIGSRIKTLLQACSAENYSHEHLLTTDNFDNYAKVPYNKRAREKELLILYLSIIYKTYEELRPKITEFVGEDHDFQFYIDPINKYNDPKVNSECFENISDDELKVLIKKQDALKIMKNQANHSRWGGLFKNKLQKILWEV